MSKYINEDHSRSRYMVSENKTDVKTLRQDGLRGVDTKFHVDLGRKKISPKR